MGNEPAIEILEATYRALCENGYANLTLQDVASESSQASIHYSPDPLHEAVLNYVDAYLAADRASGVTS